MEWNVNLMLNEGLLQETQFQILEFKAVNFKSFN